MFFVKTNSADLPFVDNESRPLIVADHSGYSNLGGENYEHGDTAVFSCCYRSLFT